MNTLLGKVTRSVLFIHLVGFVFSHANFVLPGKRLGETLNWIAIRHPKPAYPVHILIIPKRAIKDWLAIPMTESELYGEFVELSQRLIKEEYLEQKGYRLIINGGPYQSIPQLHIHLVSGDASGTIGSPMVVGTKDELKEIIT